MIEKLISLLFGGGGALGAVTGAAKSLSLVALAPLAWHWFNGHAADVVYTVHVDDAAILALAVFALLQMAHQARP